MADGDLLTVSEIAARTGYTIQHVAYLLRTGKIAGRKYGPVWLTTWDAVEHYLRTDPKPGPRPGERDH